MVVFIPRRIRCETTHPRTISIANIIIAVHAYKNRMLEDLVEKKKQKKKKLKFRIKKRREFRGTDGAQGNVT